MDIKDIISGMVMLILIYLLVSHGSATNQVIQGLSGGLTSVIATLQGRGSGGFGAMDLNSGLMNG